MLLFSLTGCGGQQPPAPAAPGTAVGDQAAATDSTETRRPVVAVSINNLDNTQATLLELYTEYCEENDIDLIWTSAEGSIDKQVTDIESMIVQKPDVIACIAVDADAGVDLFKMVTDAGIIFCQHMSEINSDEVEYMTVNRTYERGVYHGNIINEYMEKNPGKDIKIGYMLGALGFSSVNFIKQGMDDTLISKWAGTGRCEIIAEKTANWKSDEAMALAEDWIQAYPEINVIVAQNDEMAVGACQAYAAAGKKMGEDIIIIGADGSPAGQTEIQNGNMYASVFMNRPEMALASCQQWEKIARAVMEGKELPPEERGVEITRMGVMTKENFEETSALLNN
jgi:ABC-type sugar transport system substrate-binding protein